jgi:hypothetical protein
VRLPLLSGTRIALLLSRLYRHLDTGSIRGGELLHFCEFRKYARKNCTNRRGSAMAPIRVLKFC